MLYRAGKLDDTYTVVVVGVAKPASTAACSRGAWSRSEHLVLLLVALSFSKLQTFLNNIPEGNTLKPVYIYENCIYIQAYVVS